MSMSWAKTLRGEFHELISSTKPNHASTVEAWFGFEYCEAP